MSEQTMNDLEQMHRQALAKQDQFMLNIAARLGRKEPLAAPPSRAVKGAPAYWNEFDLSLAERAELFMNNWKLAGGHSVRVPHMQAAKEYVQQLIVELQATHLLLHDHALLHQLAVETCADVESTYWDVADIDEYGREQLQAVAAGADIGFIVAEQAVAYTGSVVTMSASRQGRTVSLLPTALVILIPAERLLTRLGEVLRPLDALPLNQLPAGVHFISGPSRSADIENDLTIGVHGPGVVYAIIVDDLT
ncbi:LutC/YkgG family protein [Paenibacillus marinisediminis]